MNNYSKQREVILEVIKQNRTHPTAEEIYDLVIKEEPKISKSTVYRNINILVENKTIKRITTPGGPDRFDYFYEPHHHVICDMCREVFDFQYPLAYEKMAKSIKDQTGVETKVDCITVNGICETCKSKIEKK